MQGERKPLIHHVLLQDNIWLLFPLQKISFFWTELMVQIHSSIKSSIQNLPKIFSMHKIFHFSILHPKITIAQTSLVISAT